MAPSVHDVIDDRKIGATERLKSPRLPIEMFLSHQSFCLPNRSPNLIRRLRHVACYTRHLLYWRTLVIKARDPSMAPSVQSAVDDKNIGATERLKFPLLPSEMFLSHQSFFLPNRIPSPCRRSRQVDCYTRHLLYPRPLVIKACDPSMAPSVHAVTDDRNIGATERLKSPSLLREMFLSHRSFCLPNRRVL
ncbi:hypothetical protein Rcae01_00123 [Novipirellula caenicola]|uniref:Uncharacterized protein n=1 Tax=Novipirellula caenicola TaxID=1536901 RepID=A0ABP9VHJ3_9BACT